ncbi:hypothetical protein I7I50_06344 [Histoplasma capsulatum G186AR]|uniref:Uncharacterized protein n=1 Tax=Ajellomyces capsulatus TaxID=5037 RepID=A0A8H7Z2R5_AJECA|nr:hypothetical protein I7I52_10583 [Histoplasma capsulatum]QSS67313.1 hypothetical protein I7I50_06344 [Histoplasma capsulatum G186AR]
MPRKLLLCMSSSIYHCGYFHANGKGCRRYRRNQIMGNWPQGDVEVECGRQGGWGTANQRSNKTAISTKLSTEWTAREKRAGRESQ